MDRSFRDAWDNAKIENAQELWNKAKKEHYDYQVHLLARAMAEGRYPTCIGSYGNLNTLGQKLIDYNEGSWEHRTVMAKSSPETRSWKTFRDVDNAEMFRSLFTEKPACPLKIRWMDILDVNDPAILS